MIIVSMCLFIQIQFGPRSPSFNNPKVVTSSAQSTWQARGGPGRLHDVLMELQLNKVT
jgi:hypothetical protein